MTEVKTPEAQQAAKKPPEPKRKYRILVPGDYIERCSYILPNKLQCWKAGEEEVTESSSAGIEVRYQYCERHARIRRAIEAGTMQAEQVATQFQALTVEPPPSAPELVKEVEPVKTPPKSEEEKEEGNRPFFKKESEVHEVRKDTDKK